MWAKNLLFVGLSILGLSGLAASLLDDPGLEPPESFAPGVEVPEYPGREITEQVDQTFRAHRSTRDVETAGPADDLVVIRRLGLALMGTIPSLEEVRAIQALPPEQRIPWWLARTFEDRRYADYVGERFARAFVGTQNGPFLVYRRRRFVSWLSDQLHENRPYDELVRTLVSDTGLWTDSPAVNFLTVTLDENDDGRPDPIRLAARTSRAFLGMRIDCLQCHDDNLGTIELGPADDPRGGAQSDFHQLAAFYSEAKSSLFGVIDDQELYRYKYLEADEEDTIDPVPPFQAELLATDGSRREKLAHWLTHEQNRAFSRAIVNRVWALLFGRPLVEPIDDIPLHGEVPPALDILAADVVANGYDLQRLIRVIAATEVFQLDSRASFEVTPLHEEQWAVFPLSRLRPEQVAGAISQSASVKTIDATSHILFQLRRFLEQNDFVKRYGDTGEDEFDERAGTIAQRLLLMNGKLVKERTEVNLVTNAASQIGALAPTDPQAVELAYLAILTRPPTDAESEHFAARLAGSKGDERNRHMEDLYWVLINSTEFSWNH